MVKEISKTDAGGMNFTLVFGFIAQEYCGQVKGGGGFRPQDNPETLNTIFISSLPNKPFYCSSFICCS